MSALNARTSIGCASKSRSIPDDCGPLKQTVLKWHIRLEVYLYGKHDYRYFGVNGKKCRKYGTRYI